jgi:phospholipid/cholesterol/gamma-HCH transport system permease protein
LRSPAKYLRKKAEMTVPAQAEPILIDRVNDDLNITLKGDWLIGNGVPDTSRILSGLSELPAPTRLVFRNALGLWDSSLLTFLMKCQDLATQQGIKFEDTGLPEGARRLLALARTVPPKTDTRKSVESSGRITRIGESVLSGLSGAWRFIGFMGETVLSLGRFARGRAQFQWSQVGLVIQQCGPSALGIVALINFLVGMILAFVGAVQLTQFGAAVFVADLVAVATAREMGAIMTAIIISGRTGAAFAAELGTMTVNQEVDALKTFGISSIDFLVLPRVIALILMMPLLTVFADVIAIAGGFFVSVLALDLNPQEYIRRSIDAISLNSFLIGVFKGGLFGALVGMAGCYYGIQSGRDASAVGQATTSAVVAGITAIIAADGMLAILTNMLGV